MAEGLEQDDFEFQPQREIHGGVEFEFSGTLFVPAPGGTKQLEHEQQQEAEAKERRTHTKMNFKDFVKMRAK